MARNYLVDPALFSDFERRFKQCDFRKRDEAAAIEQELLGYMRTYLLDTTLQTRGAKMLTTMGKLALAVDVLGESEVALLASGKPVGAVSVKRGDILMDMGRFDEALVCMDRALKCNGRNHAAIVNKAECLAKLNRAKDGETFLFSCVGFIENNFINGILYHYRKVNGLLQSTGPVTAVGTFVASALDRAPKPASKKQAAGGKPASTPRPKR